MEKQAIVAGTDTWLGIDPGYSDDEIREFCEEFYGWEDVKLKRMKSIVLVQPEGEDD